MNIVRTSELRMDVIRMGGHELTEIHFNACISVAWRN